jgi:hypothetical protein
MYIQNQKIRQRLLDSSNLTLEEISKFLDLIVDSETESKVWSMWTGYRTPREADMMYDKIEKCVRHFIMVGEIDDYFDVA